jgi:carboxyl-terminal processing protease
MPRKGYVLFVLFLLASAMFVGRAFSADKDAGRLKTLERILTAVEQEYVKPVKSEDLFDGAYRGILSTLDPYSQFFDVQETTSFAEDTEGQFGGLGIEISLKDGILTVLSPLRGTPAWDAGILPGDMVLKIDGAPTDGISLEEALHKLRGPVDASVTLTVRHVGAPIDVEIPIVRAVIQPKSVEFAMIDDKLGIGLMRVISFNAHVMNDLMQGVKELQDAGLKSLVLDLRGNPGGLLDKAVEMSDLFLAKGVIVSVRGRRPAMDKKYEARPGDPLEELPIIMLVDEASASASEIVAAALKDNGRSLLVGSRTFGKGSVQNVFSLGNGEALKLTTARYYRPNDQPIEDRKGIIPDVEVPVSREEILALRVQEREDKLRGTYNLQSLIEEPAPEAREETISTNPKDPFEEIKEPAAKEPPRRGRVADHQFKAAYNILKWQLTEAK